MDRAIPSCLVARPRLVRWAVLATGLVLANAVDAQPIGTAFTYQGRLADAGNPANGAYDLQLALFDAPSGGAQVGATLTRDDVVVANGLFTVPLDFGAVFSGSKRWLELRVRPGAGTGAFTTLAGRQELTPSPNAVFSSAAPWTGISGKPAGFADDVDDDALGALSCPNGQIAKRVSGAWACAGDNAHDHLAQSWTGSTATGLEITNATGVAVRGVSNGSAADTTAVQGEISGTTGQALLGTATATTGFGVGVRGRSGSRDGAGVSGEALATEGVATGVLGASAAPGGRGVVGTVSSNTGINVGVVGLSGSTSGTGVMGMALASSGSPYGVRGQTSSAAGFGGFFENSSGGPAIGVSTGGIRFADGTTQTTAASGWSLGGNAGTNPSENFLGTTDNVPLELRVNALRALRLDRATIVGPFGTYAGQNALGGDPGNSIATDVTGATIAGGGGTLILTSSSVPQPNRVTDVFGTVGGGWNNQAGDGAGTSLDQYFATVGGGATNSATRQYATVGGGLENQASAPTAVVAGGRGNRASGFGGFVGGGQSNQASGSMSAVGGGEANQASGFNASVLGGSGSRASGDYSSVVAGWGTTAGGAYSLAAGRLATVRSASQSGDADGDEGTFVWADSVESSFASTGPNQFLIRAGGGVGINTNTPPPGGLAIANAGKLAFGSTARQVIDLNSAAYGIGVQGGVVYFRTEPPGGNFTWFMGGSHSNTQNDPGPGGVRQMRLDGAGNLFVRGAFSPGGADFAELLAAEPGLEPGDVLAIGPGGELTLTTSPYQDSIAGVYSTKPGLVGGAPDGGSTDGKVPLAVAGIVPVKVTDEGGPIAPGDALTSSSTPGHAMKAAKVRVGGIAFFPSGVVIGKALEPLRSGSGIVRALVVLQ